MDHRLSNLLQIFTLDPEVDEIFCNGERSLSYLKKQRLYVAAPIFEDSLEMLDFLQEFAFSQGKRLDPLSPSVGGTLFPDAIRWHCIISPEAPEGPLLSLRRHRFSSLTLEDFQLTSQDQTTLERIFQDKHPLLLCGPTGSGKTTLLYALLQKYAQGERILFLEDIPEIPIANPLWVRLSCQKENREGRGSVTWQNLFVDSLRLRPDRIVIGEMRGVESFVFFEAIKTGHEGVLSTFHAGSLSSVKERLEIMGSQIYHSRLSFMQLLGDSFLHCCFLRRGPPFLVVEIW